MTRRSGLYLGALAAAALLFALTSDADAFGRRNGGSCGSHGGNHGSWGGGGSRGSNGGSFGGFFRGNRGGSWGSNGSHGSNGGSYRSNDCGCNSGCQAADDCDSCGTAYSDGHHEEVVVRENGREEHTSAYRGERSMHDSEPEIAQREERRELDFSDREADRANQDRQQETFRDGEQPALEKPAKLEEQRTAPDTSI